MKFDPLKLADRIPVDGLKRKALDVLLTFGIPFNRWLGMRLEHFSPDKVVVVSPPKVLRQNHVGGAHACALALLGEYPAGLLVAQNFPLETYRMIISELNIEYSKQGKGTLRGEAKAPDHWPELVDEEGWVPMKTDIINEKGDVIAICRTKWQVKSWAKIERDKAART